MRRRGARMAALALVICAAGRGRLAGAQEDAEAEDASRARILAAALTAKGPRRVFLRGNSGSCTPWGAREMQKRGVQDDGDAEGDPQVGYGAATACAHGGPALRGRDAERRETSERAAYSCAPAGRLASLAAADERLLLRGAPGVGGVPGGALEGLLEHIEDSADGAPSLAAVPGGGLDGLHEHIEDGASARGPMPRGGGRSLDCLPGSTGARYFFGSPLGVALDVAGVAGLAAQYLFYHTFVLLVPSGLRRSDRAVGAAVIWLARIARLSRAAMPLHPRLLCEPRGALSQGACIVVSGVSFLVCIW